MWRSKSEVDRHVRELLAKIKNEQDRKLRGYSIARLYYGVGEYESARRYLSEFISIRPKSPEAQRLLGEIYESLNQKERAVFSYITSYTISDAQKDLVLKICELYTTIDNGDNAARLHWAEEGERLFPHHNSVLKLREALNLNRSIHSKEDLETIYKQEAEANPTSLNVHLKLLKLYGEWSKEDESKLTDAFHFVVRVESRRLFFNSFEWYHNVVSIIEAYESWKKPHKDKHFEELVLSILDRYVYQSLVSSCCSPLTASCSVNEAAKKLQRFGDRLTDTLKILGKESFCGEHMIRQYYFHLATLLAIKAKNESVYHKEYLLGLLLIHSCEATKQHKVPSNSREIELIKSFWYNVGCHRVSQSGHVLTQLAASDGGEKKYVNKLKEISADPDTRKNIITFLFGLSSFSENSLIKCDENFGKEILFVNKATLLQCDQDVSLFCCSDLRELVWLYMQYDNTSNATVMELKPKYFYFNFHIFRGIPFSSKVTTNAPETLSHLDVLAFVVATAFCHYSNDRNYAEGNHYPSILCPDLHTVEQNEWWSSAATLCNNSSSKNLNRLRSVLQNGLESIRHLSPHFVPLPLTVHLARYFTSCFAKSGEDCNSESEIDALGERAEYYWNKVISKCKKSSNMIFGSTVKSRLFELPRTDISESEKLEFEEEGRIFIAERLSLKGLKQEAIQMLSTMKTPRASFKRAMLYKEEAKELVKNCNLNSISIATKNEYISLLNQARDAIVLTMEMPKKQGIDSSDGLSTEFNIELNEELASIERSLAAVSVDDITCDESSHGSPSFHSVLDLTNGNASSWGRLQPHNSSTPYRALTSNPRITRQETSPGPPAGLVSQVKQLEEIQQNNMRNIENHNAALRAQNEALLQTCQTMAAEFKQNVAFYKSFLGQKSNTDSMEPFVDQMKELSIDIKELRVEFKALSAEVNDLRSCYATKPNPQQIIGTTSAAADNSSSVYANSPAAIQDVYNTYMGFYNQPSVASPLVAPTPVFSSFQPPFLPPSTLQDQTYLHSHQTVVKAEQCLPTTEYASSNYQNICSSPSGYVSRTQSTMKNIQSKGPTNGIAPPHSFQIQLPSSETLTTFAAETTLKSSSPVFTTEGLLSTVPAPLYSAVTTNLSSQNASSKNLLEPARNISTSVDTSIKSSSPVFTTEGLLSNVPAPLYSAIIAVPTPEKTAPKTLEPPQNQPSGLFSKVNLSSGTLGFDAIAANSPYVSIFQTKDDAAFQPKPLFGSSNDSRNKSVNGDGSKDEIEDYEPQVEFKPVVPMPDLVEIKTGEEDEERLFCERVKLFRYDVASKEWKERGVGELKLLKNKLSLKVRILMRREQTHKVCANHFIAADTKISAMVNSEKACVWAANDFADEEIKYEQFAARFKNQKLANEFRTTFEAAQKNLPTPAQENIKKKTDASKTPANTLSDMFKPAAGSWECAGCYIVNKPDVNSCPACLTSKPGSVKPSPCQGISTVLSEMFKPAAGSWECSGCYIVNKPDVNSCPACQTPKPGCEQSGSNVISDNKSGIFSGMPLSFGMPASASPFNFGFSAPSTSTTTTFSFGIPPTTASSSMPTMAVTSTVKNESVTFSSTAETGAFSWKPAVETTIMPTSQLPKPSDKQELIFGSPGKAEFSFSGVKSPKPKNQSICESEDGVVAEEEDDNIYFEPVIPLPEKVEVITGEENETALFSHRAKLYRLCSGEWKERGLGDIKILQHKETLKIRLLMRREQVLKICLNHYLSKEMEFKVKDDKSFFWGATDFTENEPSIETFAIRFKTAEIANSFFNSIKEAQASMVSSPDKSIQKNIQSSDVSSSAKICEKNSKLFTLRNMFQPAVGSWECTGCLIVNNPDVTSCPACKTPKPGLELQEGKSNASAPKSTFGAKPPPFVTTSTASVFSSFSFGLSAAPTTTTFSFGLPSVASTPTLEIKQLNDADSIQVLFEKKASPELREKARKLKLPENFYLFENAEPCPGCIGCEKENLKTELCTTPSNSSKSGIDNIKINLFGETTQKAVSTSTFAPTTQSGLFGSSTATTIKFGSSLPDISSSFGLKPTFGISSTTSTFAVKPIEMPPLFGVSPSLSSGNIFGSKTLETPTLFGSAPSASLSNILGAKLEEKPAASPAVGLFGVKPSVAQPLFGGPVSSVSSPIFGGKAEGKPVNSSFSLFGDKTSEAQSLFGSANTVNSSNIFDVKTEEKPASTTPFSLFETKPESQPLFGTLPSMGSPSIFGGKIEDKSSTSGGLFGGKLSEPQPLFGSTPSGSSSNIFGSITEEKNATQVTFNLFESKTSEAPTPLFGFSTSMTSSNVETKAPQSPLLFGAAHSTTNIFGGKPVEVSIFGKQTDQSASVFGIKAGETNSIFAPKTNEAISNFNSSSSGINTSIFGPKPGETNTSIFSPTVGKPNVGPKSQQTSNSIFSPKNGQANDTNVNTPTFENKSSNIFSPKPDVSIFGMKANDTNEKLFNSVSIQIVNKPSAVDSTAAPLFSSPASAVSFGDIAKADASFSFKNSTPSDSSAWVSKPLFGGGVKSPEKEESDDYDPHYEPVIPMPDLIEIKTGEEGWQELFSQRAKLFRYDAETKQWKERGIGEFKIQFEPQLVRYRLLQRREQIHKLSCNHYLTLSMELEPMLTSEVAWCWFATDYSEQEGEAMKLAVKFKTKDIAIKFQEVFNECKSKLALSAMTIQQTPEHGDFTKNSFATAQADSSAQHCVGDNEDDDDDDDDDDDEDEDTDSDGQTGSSQQHADGDYEDVEDYEQTALMTEPCSLYKLVDGGWQAMGEGEMVIYYDNESNGARIVVTTPDDERMSDNLITMESTMNDEENHEISWRAIDELSCPPESVCMKAKFLSSEAAQSFQTTFGEGKGFAEHHCIKEQDVLLYYGVETNDD